MLKFYNTLTREKEEFKPLNDKTVKMYSCGPTVYSYAHIGNMRAYVFVDILRRVLNANGYKIKGVLNVTDVGHLLDDSDDGEDKMVLASYEQNKTPKQIADHYAEAFFSDLKRLNISKPEIIAYATEHIDEMREYVQKLMEKGFAYETGDGVYFDISKFPEYGKLSRLNLDEQKAGARVEVNEEKRNPSDFALWKKAEKNHIMQWESPWGMSFPGWHIECSAMSKKYLGSEFDIHTGGIDHIPVHHENEIAQSEALEGKKCVNYWLHNEFMQVDGGKMSKSLKNTYTISDLIEKGYSPLSFRYFCLNAHHGKKINFTFEGMNAAATSLKRLYLLILKHKNGINKTNPAVLEKYKAEFFDAINDDLNVPLALGVLWTMLKDEALSKDIYDLSLEFDKIFGLELDKAKEEENLDNDPIPQEILDIANERLTARQNKDFATSDILRDKLSNLGYQILDAKDSYILKKI